MLKPISSASDRYTRLRHQDDLCPTRLTLLSWNVAKLSGQPAFHEVMAGLLEQESINLVLLQEARTFQREEFDLHGYSWSISPNIQTRTELFGVMSAFNVRCDQSTPFISQRQELMYATHKSALVTHHPLQGGVDLLVVNVHAINFVLNQYFYEEMASISRLIAHHDGPLVIAGDFNTWNAKRIYHLRALMTRLGLREVEFADKHHIKRFLWHPLDYVFYRGLHVEHARAINTNISDHNPVLTTLSLAN